MASRLLSRAQLPITGSSESYLLHGFRTSELNPNLYWPLAHVILSSFDYSPAWQDPNMLASEYSLGSASSGPGVSRDSHPCLLTCSPLRVAVSVCPMMYAQSLSPPTLLIGCCPRIAAGSLNYWMCHGKTLGWSQGSSPDFLLPGCVILSHVISLSFGFLICKTEMMMMMVMMILTWFTFKVITRTMMLGVVWGFYLLSISLLW